MDPIVYWFKTEVYFWRSAGSLFWSILCFPPVTVVYVLLCNLSLFQPLTGLSGDNVMYSVVYDLLAFTQEVLSASFLLWLTLLTLVLTAVACTATFTVVPDVPETRLQSYLGLLRLSRLPHAVVSTLGGACVAWCCTHFVKACFSGLTRTVIISGQEFLALNEPHFFVVLSGGTAGLIYYANFHLQHHSYLAFPTLQRDKYFRVRGEMLKLVGRCSRLVWIHIQLFYLWYWLMGGTYRTWVEDLLNLETVVNEHPLDSIFGLLDISLLWQTALCAFFIFFSWGFTAVLYRVYHTQRLELPVVTAFSSKTKHCLGEALACHTAPLLQHLAFLDLAYLAEHSPSRRQDVYSLSQPGGHPHTWRAICSACLQQIEMLMAQVQAANLKTLTSVPLHHPAEKIFPTGTDTPSLSLPQGPPEKLPVMNKVYAVLKDKPVLKYFLQELPDAKSRQLFAGCQLQIWAIEALSQLASASYTEDKYGVVQQTLTSIFSDLVALQDSVEKHFKLQPVSVKRSGRDIPPQPHDMLRQQLRVTLKRAVYCLVNQFGKHLGDLQLAGDCLKRLRPFMDYKE